MTAAWNKRIKAIKGTDQIRKLAKEWRRNLAYATQTSLLSIWNPNLPVCCRSIVKLPPWQWQGAITLKRTSEQSSWTNLAPRKLARETIWQLCSLSDAEKVTKLSTCFNRATLNRSRIQQWIIQLMLVSALRSIKTTSQRQIPTLSCQLRFKNLVTSLSRATCRPSR